MGRCICNKDEEKLALAFQSSMDAAARAAMISSGSSPPPCADTACTCEKGQEQFNVNLPFAEVPKTCNTAFTSSGGKGEDEIGA
jgi:hypothetical protein